jgi:hypothetical protein
LTGFRRSRLAQRTTAAQGGHSRDGDQPFQMMVITNSGRW